MAFLETIKEFFSWIVSFITSKISQICLRMYPPSSSQPPSSSSTDIESQPVDVPQQNYNLFLHQWKHVVTAFCLEAALQIALASAQIQSQLPVSFHILSLAILLIFLSLFVSSFIGSNFTSRARVLEMALGLLVTTTVVFTITIPFPLSLKCVSWALFAISLITILICRASRSHSVPTH